MKQLLTVLSLMLLYVVALAQVGSPSPMPSPAHSADVVSQITAWLNAHMMMAVMAGGVVIHILASLWPTAQPQSVLIWVNAGIEKLQGLLKALSDLSDKLLQNLKG